MPRFTETNPAIIKKLGAIIKKLGATLRERTAEFVDEELPDDIKKLLERMRAGVSKPTR